MNFVVTIVKCAEDSTVVTIRSTSSVRSVLKATTEMSRLLSQETVKSLLRTAVPAMKMVNQLACSSV